MGLTCEQETGCILPGAERLAVPQSYQMEESGKILERQVEIFLIKTSLLNAITGYIVTPKGDTYITLTTKSTHQDTYSIQTHY